MSLQPLGNTQSQECEFCTTKQLPDYIFFIPSGGEIIFPTGLVKRFVLYTYTYAHLKLVNNGIRVIFYKKFREEKEKYKYWNVEFRSDYIGNVIVPIPYGPSYYDDCGRPKKLDQETMVYSKTEPHKFSIYKKMWELHKNVPLAFMSYTWTQRADELMFFCTALTKEEVYESR